MLPMFTPAVVLYVFQVETGFNISPNSQGLKRMHMAPEACCAEAAPRAVVAGGLSVAIYTLKYVQKTLLILRFPACLHPSRR